MKVDIFLIIFAICVVILLKTIFIKSKDTFRESSQFDDDDDDYLFFL